MMRRAGQRKAMSLPKAERIKKYFSQAGNYVILYQYEQIHIKNIKVCTFVSGVRSVGSMED